jgi:hypothetical protein
MPDVSSSRQPLINRQSKIIATRLTLHAEWHDDFGRDTLNSL